MEQLAKQSVLERIHEISRTGGQLPNAGTRFRVEPYLAETEASIPEGSTYHTLDEATQGCLLSSTVRLLHSYNNDTEDDVFTDPLARGRAVDEAAVHTERLIQLGWSGKYAARLAIRHSADDLESMIEVYCNEHPIFTKGMLQVYIYSNTTRPRAAIEDVVDAFYDLRVNQRVLQPSNVALHKALSVKAIRDKDYTKVYDRQNELYQPLSDDPAEGFRQLQAFVRENGMAAASKVPEALALYVKNFTEAMFEDYRRINKHPSRSVEFPYFTDIIARYADRHDYRLLEDNAYLEAIAQHFIEHVMVLETYDLPDALAEQCAMRRPADYYDEALARWEACDYAKAMRDFIISNMPSTATDRLMAVCDSVDEIQKSDEEITQTQALNIAMTAERKSRAVREQLEEFYADVEAASILYGALLSPAFIRTTCAVFSGTYMQHLGEAKERLETYEQNFYDPCMPDSFLRAAAESKLARTPKIVRQHYLAAQEIRTRYQLENGEPINDQELWRRVREQLHETSVQ